MAQKPKTAIPKELRSGLDKLKGGDSQGAFDFFAAAQAKDSDNPRVNFYLGLAAMKLGKFEEAISAFDRVLIVEPQHTRAKYESARCYFVIGRYDYAEPKFQEVLQDKTIPAAIRANTEKYLAAIEASKKRGRLSVALAIGAAYDTNVYNDTGADERLVSAGYMIGGTILFPDELAYGNEPKKDAAHQETAQIGYAYDFGDMGGWIWQNSLVGFAQSYFKESDADLLYGSLSSGFARRDNRTLYQAALYGDRIFVGGDGYTTSFGARLSHMRAFGDGGDMGEISLSGGKKTYDDDKNRDATIGEISIGWHDFNEDSSVFVRGAYGLEDAKIALGNSRTYFGLSAGYTRVFSVDWLASIGASYKMTTYDEKAINLSSGGAKEQREEKLLGANLSCGYRLGDNWRLSAEYSYMKNDSNFAAFNWDKHSIVANLSWFWQR